MSIRLMTFAWDHAPIGGSKLNVLLILADHANDEGRCWPSITRIGHRARLSERQTQRVIRELEDEGLLRIDKRSGESSIYTVLLGGVTSTSGVTFALDTPDIAVSPEPSLEPPLHLEKETSKENRPTATQIERESIDRIWTYWLQVSSKRQNLDEKRKRIIRNTLRIGFSEEDVKRALLGLVRSPFHNGQNEQHRSYLEIRYALKGRGDESDDERIEKAITWAAMYGGQQQFTDPAKVQRWLDEVRYTLSQPYRPERARGLEAHRKLVAAGFTVTRLDKPPWARISR